ncbi:MAG: aryl-sulfate sulfotransferase [Chloroflexota bacterium]
MRKCLQLCVLLFSIVLLVGFGRVQAQSETGVLITSDAVSPGYVLFAPAKSTTTYLVNNAGEVVHTWESRYITGHATYLKPNGNLLRAGSYPTSIYTAGGSGGIIEEIDWNGNVVWSYIVADAQRHAHHDYELLPNGNILIIAWEGYSVEAAAAAGRRPELMPEGLLWSEVIIEVDPRSNQVVWEWRAWDHLVQDYDPNLLNYGDVMANPGKIDINYLGARAVGSDWLHFNAIDYNADLNQIMLSTPFLQEVWIIDHGLTTEQAAGPAGDLLYRFGNRAAYKAPGGPSLSSQHDAEWLSNDRAILFNNGTTRGWSSVDEWTLPIQPDGTYIREADGTFRSPGIVWQFRRDDFFADRVSGAQRLPNGNTLIAEGPEGRILEVQPDYTVVWEYVSPFAPEDNPQIFRAERYPPDYPAFVGRGLP